MSSKFIPYAPATIVGIAEIAAHAEMRRMSSFCQVPTRACCAPRTESKLVQGLDLGDGAVQVIVDVADVRGDRLVGVLPRATQQALEDGHERLHRITELAGLPLEGVDALGVIDTGSREHFILEPVERGAHRAGCLAVRVDGDVQHGVHTAQGSGRSICASALSAASPPTSFSPPPATFTIGSRPSLTSVPP
ncbi:hypothetical protein ADK93_04585 [Streptomyces sp. XY58]|nr:hypothetical protein ADK93_04585 [Streptomyces sp. XY58]KOV00420.1 hypothetical protein ADK89_33480 [Streptomyces sp. XY37]KOV40761.1 hypothetical protein ADK99_33620 [Streptomyces sp. MMG1064]